MIRFKELIPSPLAGTDLSDSGLWACKEQHLATSSSYLIHSPSGKGKSTFLSILYGIRKDWVGEVSLFEKDIQTYSENEWEELRRQQLSYVFQGLRLFPNLSAMDNIQLKNSLSDFKSEHEIKQMAQVLEVDSLLQKPVAKLSFGQQQRVAIIRALCQPFEWLLLDEPFSHIDHKLQQAVWKLIKEEQAKQGAGVIITLLKQADWLQTDQTIVI